MRNIIPLEDGRADDGKRYHTTIMVPPRFENPERTAEPSPENANESEFVAAPEVDVVDTTAAGDTLLAEYCWSGDAAWAVAAGSAACTMPGGSPPPIDVVRRLKEGA